MRRIMSAGLVCMLAMSLVVGCGSKKEETETKTEEKQKIHLGMQLKRLEL